MSILKFKDTYKCILNVLYFVSKHDFSKYLVYCYLRAIYLVLINYLLR